MFATVLLALATAPSAAALAQDPSPAATEVARQATAGVQLAHARSVKAKARGTKGAARVEALERAAAAFAAVGQYWPDSGVITAEAAFRRGEIQRTLGRAGSARGAFQEAFDAGTGTDFAPRALLEIGHLHRRAAEYGKALQHYRRAHDLEGAPLRYQNDAREWTGKVQLALSNWKEAETAFQSWSANAEGPVEVVRAMDLAAQAVLGGGELARAEKMVDDLAESLEGLAAEPSKDGEALKKALERMKTPELVAEARRKEAEKNGGVAIG